MKTCFTLPVRRLTVLSAIAGGAIFSRGAQGTDAIFAAVLVICGVVALTTGIAIGEIVAALNRQSDGER